MKIIFPTELLKFFISNGTKFIISCVQISFQLTGVEFILHHFLIYCLLCVINIYIVFDIFSLLLNLNFFFFLVLILKTGKSSLAKPHWVMSFVCWLDSVQATLGPRYVLNMCIKYICMFQSFLILLENSINIL